MARGAVYYSIFLITDVCSYWLLDADTFLCNQRTSQIGELIQMKVGLTKKEEKYVVRITFSWINSLI